MPNGKGGGARLQGCMEGCRGVCSLCKVARACAKMSMGGLRLWVHVLMPVHIALSMFTDVNIQMMCLHLVGIPSNFSSIAHGPPGINISAFLQNSSALASNQCIHPKPFHHLRSYLPTSTYR